MIKNLIRITSVVTLVTISSLMTSQLVLGANDNFNPDFTSDVANIHFNWGTGKPDLAKSPDNFTARYRQMKVLNPGDYFVQTLADDGVRVTVDEGELKPKIDRLTSFSNRTDSSLWLGVSAGNHMITTDYLELANDAAVFSDVVPFGSWLAYYYDNPYLKGLPISAKVIEPVGKFDKLSENNSFGSPTSGMPNDNFSAKYTTAKRITAGNYILRTKADDGVRVYLDGKLILDRWNQGAHTGEAIQVKIADRSNYPVNEKDVHWIEVEYRENTARSEIDVFLEPYESAIASSSTWIGEFFENDKFRGVPLIVGGNNSFEPVTAIDYNWGQGSPLATVPKDHFSARFTKNIRLSEAKTYIVDASADDGVRVSVDGKVV
ncbi:hypothetical protein GH741_14900, partial [Aquibacillus halophilus]